MNESAPGVNLRMSLRHFNAYILFIIGMLYTIYNISITSSSFFDCKLERQLNSNKYKAA